MKEVSEESLQDEDTQEYIKATEFMAENAKRSIDEEFSAQVQDATKEILEAEKKAKKES